MHAALHIITRFFMYNENNNDFDVGIHISPATLQISGPLFETVQKDGIFEDSKTFVDLPLIEGVNLQQIYDEYIAQKSTDTFNIREFIHRFFKMPEKENTLTSLAPKQNMMTHIHQLWDVLSRPKDEHNNNTLIPLPFPYLVPGGRFREVYYWDSYFTSIGLVLEQRYDLIENMLKNFKYLVDTFGFVPNGNRIYYNTRSQPPVLSCIVDIFVKHRGHSAIKEYLPTLEKEYTFWMRGKDKVSAELPYHEHVVRMPCGSLLNRYYDSSNTPRPESYREDIAAFKMAKGFNRKLFYQHIRAACESGWDFSSRWLADITSFSSIETLNIIPVDLNMWLYLLEFRIACYHQALGQDLAAHHFFSLAEQRKMAINKYCWSDENGFYFDYNLRTQCLSSVYALSGCTPLFAHMSNQEQAKSIAKVLFEKFLKTGGLVTTLHTLQQWDAPNGWAPLQYLAVQGLLNYQQTTLANTIMELWLKTNQNRYDATGKMLEKYNVCDPSNMPNGGEYPSQDGFGWTNAIALKFSALLLQNQPQVNDNHNNALKSATRFPVLHLQTSANIDDSLSIQEQRKFHFFSY